MIFRRQWLAFAGTIVVMTLVSYTPASTPAADLLIVAGFAVLFLAALTRFGLLTAITGFALWGVEGNLPITADLTRWYAYCTFLAVAIPAAIALYGFVVSFGGRPIFRDTLDPR